ncbi:MAG: hypothetical protein LQ344_007973 [Seirophora lacunosa]|nr:MAG: hypothetical protein LQ344_007973 [Seirophora lacunosa]
MSDLRDSSDSSDDSFEPNTLDDDDEWKDVESENVIASFVSFGGSIKYPKIEEFLEDARDRYGVDLISIKNSHGLDTFGMIKLINFVRSQVRQGLSHPDVSPERFIEGDEYLKPVIEDDAVLYSIDDIFDLAERQAHSSTNGTADTTHSHEQVQEMIRQIDLLREQAVYYRSALQKTYLEKLELLERTLSSEPKASGEGTSAPPRENDSDSHYFSSYAHNGQSPQASKLK